MLRCDETTSRAAACPGAQAAGWTMPARSPQRSGRRRRARSWRRACIRARTRRAPLGGRPSGRATRRPAGNRCECAARPPEARCWRARAVHVRAASANARALAKQWRRAAGRRAARHGRPSSGACALRCAPDQPASAPEAMVHPSSRRTAARPPSSQAGVLVGRGARHPRPCHAGSTGAQRRAVLRT